MRRLLVVLALLGLAAVIAPLTARAANTQVVSCAHVHMTYRFQAGDASFPVSVSGDCANGSAVSTSVAGTGTGTFLDTLLGTPCPRGGDVDCLQFALSLPIGATSAGPTFQTVGYVYPAVSTGLPASTFDYAEANTIQAFATGSGSGSFNSICNFTNPYINCTVDGAFTWAPGASA